MLRAEVYIHTANKLVYVLLQNSCMHNHFISKKPYKAKQLIWEHFFQQQTYHIQTLSPQTELEINFL